MLRWRMKRAKHCFHFMKWNIYCAFILSLKERHSCLREHQERLLSTGCRNATQSYWPEPSLLQIRLRRVEQTHRDTCTTCRQRREICSGVKGYGNQSQTLNIRPLHVQVCECEVRAKIFKAYIVMLCHRGRRWSAHAAKQIITSLKPRAHLCFIHPLLYFSLQPPTHLHFISSCFSPTLCSSWAGRGANKWAWTC